MTPFLEYVYGVLFAPTVTMRRLASGQPLALAVMVQVSLAWVTTLVAVCGREPVMLWTGPGLSLAVACFTVVASLVAWVTFTGWLQLLAELFGGRSTGLLAVTGFAQLPLAFTPLVVLLGRLGGPGWEGLGGAGLMVWVTILYALAVRETHQLSTGQAAGILVVAAGAGLVLIGASIWVVVAAWPFLSQGLFL